MSPHIESIEHYLLRIVPNLAQEWEGASEEEIARIQALTPHPLPPFYLWFLHRMGRSMGAISYRLVDFSVTRILEAYAEEEEDPITPSKRYLMIGFNDDDVMPLHVWYDLERRTREDALVVQRFAAGHDLHLTFETFAEMLVWGECLSFRVCKRPQQCSGSFTDDAYEPFLCLDPVMHKLGFQQPVAMGDRCRVYERDDASMICSGSLNSERCKWRFFDFGAADEATVRSILGTIAHDTRLLVEVDKWEPPLSPR